MNLVDTDDALLATVERVPPLPAIVFALLRSLDADDANIARLARDIGQDPPLSARVLKVVNSPFYGMPGQVASLSEAVMVLGFSNVRSLALAASLSARFDFKPRGPLAPIRMWEHSFRTALCCRLLAGLARLNGETAFTVGLLHDIGRIALLNLDAERLDAILAAHGEGLPFDEAERRVLGFDHTRLGARLLERWRLPPAVVRAVECHHAPDAEPTARLTDLLCVADALAKNTEADPVAHVLSVAAPGKAFLRLGITHAQCTQALAPLDEQAKAIAGLLHEA